MTSSKSDKVREWRKANPDKYREQQLRRMRDEKARERNRKSRQQYAEKNREKILQAKRNYRTGNLKKEQAQQIQYKYGLSPGQYEAMRIAQNDRCAVCKIGPAAAVDHCHFKGTVRGLLCNPCNRGLGAFGDNREFLIGAIEYLRKTDAIPFESKGREAKEKINTRSPYRQLSLLANDGKEINDGGQTPI